MRPQPLIVSSSVPASSEWYQRVLGLTSAHGGDEYERLTTADGTLVLQLHELDVHEHPVLFPDDGRLGAPGVALWFQTDTFDADVERIRAAGADIAEDVHVNPSAQHREIWLRDPDGYVVVVAGPAGDVG
ncbi:MAG: VOC family protein [Ilumatobacter sp.]|nr:VOC family protein [Ilumatobacter sp.]